MKMDAAVARPRPRPRHGPGPICQLIHVQVVPSGGANVTDKTWPRARSRNGLGLWSPTSTWWPMTEPTPRFRPFSSSPSPRRHSPRETGEITVPIQTSAQPSLSVSLSSPSTPHPRNKHKPKGQETPGPHRKRKSEPSFARRGRRLDRLVQKGNFARCYI